MFCKKCGKKLNDEWVKCPFCGQEVSGAAVQRQENEFEKEKRADTGSDSKTVYKVRAWRRTNKFSFKNFDSNVEIQGRDVHTITWIKANKVIESNFSINDIEQLSFRVYPIWLISDIIRIAIFGLLLFATRGLSIFAVLLSVWLMLSNHLFISIKGGQVVKIPVRRKADIVDLLSKLGYSKEGIQKIEQEAISEKQANVIEWIVFTLFLLLAGATLAAGFI